MLPLELISKIADLGMRARTKMSAKKHAENGNMVAVTLTGMKNKNDPS